MAKKQAEPEAKIGHNANLNSDEKIKLSGFISEIERLNAEAKVISGDRSEIYKAAKEDGFDTKALRHVIKLRSRERYERDEFENAVDAYCEAMGDFITTPLGQAMQPQDGTAAH